MVCKARRRLKMQFLSFLFVSSTSAFLVSNFLSPRESYWNRPRPIPAGKSTAFEANDLCHFMTAGVAASTGSRRSSSGKLYLNGAIMWNRETDTDPIQNVRVVGWYGTSLCTKPRFMVSLDPRKAKGLSFVDFRSLGVPLATTGSWKVIDLAKERRVGGSLAERTDEDLRGTVLLWNSILNQFEPRHNAIIHIEPGIWGRNDKTQLEYIYMREIGERLLDPEWANDPKKLELSKGLYDYLATRLPEPITEEESRQIHQFLTTPWSSIDYPNGENTAIESEIASSKFDVGELIKFFTSRNDYELQNKQPYMEVLRSKFQSAEDKSDFLRKLNWGVGYLSEIYHAAQEMFDKSSAQFLEDEDETIVQTKKLEEPKLDLMDFGLGTKQDTSNFDYRDTTFTYPTAFLFQGNPSADQQSFFGGFMGDRDLLRKINEENAQEDADQQLVKSANPVEDVDQSSKDIERSTNRKILNVEGKPFKIIRGGPRNTGA